MGEQVNVHEAKTRLSELLAGVAPRSLQVHLDSDQAEMWQEHADEAFKVFELRNVSSNLQLQPLPNALDDSNATAGWIQSKLGGRIR